MRDMTGFRNSVRLALRAECREQAVSIDTPVFCIAHDAIEMLFSKILPEPEIKSLLTCAITENHRTGVPQRISS